ncbi:MULTISPECIES: tRNA (adenosine(37)-N6)-threonylcarbamoyltransferase complex transferase subunit TsaD [unclassified Thomasclavelia]|uniref:tRNA N6-adenosine threonylcarbamoyltransferase n=1 Tax=Candidatus Erysipelatoclostridium merdavium TaxID=2838566 RepID=A0A9D1XJ61_9FIRM|nr:MULTISPECIES: tRNA (adenosine(37)-N6)-threonylcarbamoyltransferase complex transferase subunit TsaD [unclassified Thomasclavelia]OUP78011.1 tRNA (adenosine(37)-N6)-threonylcarbamoyltransferase complex transferase subunit TsaD [Erysipelatoclostridium sp. An173]OUQ03854.1 tRNA (adenosine(37)-N6)-threonylcarbamoyltransferase complex transferase subunit TsaD [Erysipelatoclostridium sp. An15]HIX80424.1 tRNA (adenosine(37)-N6)-threonylcarbamoyltransferase complex transferase subunit TsaD [Candidatu
MSLILAIESSCDEMAMAVLKDKRDFLASVIASQIDVHALYGGVVPEIASRKHVECVSLVLKETLKKANVSIEEIDAIAVTKGPGLVGSLHIGLQAAKTIAMAYHKPLIGVHHIAGHIYANNYNQDIEYPSLCLVVSGGHSELVLLKAPFEFEVIGETLDDAVGEAYDKVGRVLNLPYPGGPVLDKMASLGNNTYDLPVPLDDDSYNFSFSGLKSAVINLNHKAYLRHEEINKNDLAASFQNVVITSLVNKTIKAAKAYNVKQVMMAGGVSANRGLRNAMNEAVSKLDNVELLLPPMSCCTDNAMMIALAAKEMYDLQIFSDLSLGIKPNIDLQQESVSEVKHNG